LQPRFRVAPFGQRATYGLFLPPRTSVATAGALHDAAKEASSDEAVKAGFDQIGMDPITLSPREYASRISRERETWRPIVQASGFTSEE